MGIFKADPGTPTKPCPPLALYSQDEQAAAAGELQAIPEPCVLCVFMDDYALLREQCR